MSTTPKSTKGPGLLISIAAIVLGIIVAVAGIIGFATRFVDFLDSPVYIVPGTARINLDTGTYLVYDLGAVGIDPSELTVTGPNGSDIRVKSTGSNQTISHGSGEYRSTVEFEGPRAGRYVLRFDNAQRTRVIVQHPLGDLVVDNIGWLLAIVVGGLIGVAGVIMLIVGIVRRSKDKGTRAMLPMGGVGGPGMAPGVAPAGIVVPAAPTAAAPTPAVAAPVVPAPPSLPAAAWFPDPHGQHRLRYWDGQAWTDHTSD